MHFQLLYLRASESSALLLYHTWAYKYVTLDYMPNSTKIYVVFLHTFINLVNHLCFGDSAASILIASTILALLPIVYLAHSPCSSVRPFPR